MTPIKDDALAYNLTQILVTIPLGICVMWLTVAIGENLGLGTLLEACIGIPAMVIVQLTVGRLVHAFYEDRAELRRRRSAISARQR